MEKQDIFEDSRAAQASRYVFMRSPREWTTGVHHVLARAFGICSHATRPCAVTMSRGAAAGTHGLPVEIEVEKQLGFNNKQQIEEYGIDKFNGFARVRFTYIQDGAHEPHRFWVDLEDAYVTSTNEYIRSVWWICFWDKDLLFKGYKVVPYCRAAHTPF